MSIEAVPRFIPRNAGVYIFSRGKTPIYIGKALNLKNRLSSYWRKNSSNKVQILLKEATKVEWIELASEIEALIKEAELIKRHIPKFNVLMRDDKNYFFVAFTKEDFPRIFLTHQPQQCNIKSIGPFTSGKALKSTLRLLRRVFPYCTCKRSHKRSCLNSEMGRCLGFCCNKNKLQITNDKLQKEYNANINNIVAVLNGRSKKLTKELKRQMQESSKKQDFEKAAKLRDQIAGLENIFRHAVSENQELEIENQESYNWGKIRRIIQAVLGLKKNVSRVEGYDISNISGTEATGSMVVFIDGYPAKSEYRKFKIKTVNQANDVRMLKEVIKRRLNHTEWPYPDLMLIDGGRPQFNAVCSQIATFESRALGRGNSKSQIVLMALAKREEELYAGIRSAPIRSDSLPAHTANFFKRVRDESHRFAKKYHHKRREILFRNE